MNIKGEDLGFSILALLQQIATLTAERDEARREVCRMATAHHGDPQAIACERGWSCYKEETK
jgi:hypothetical protein